MRLAEIWFKRTEQSEWELGVDVNEGSGPLIDRNGKVVEGPIWNTRDAYGTIMVVQDRPLPHDKGKP